MIEFLPQIIAALIIIIPLVVALIKFVAKAIKEKNYVVLVKLAMNLIVEAETKFKAGAEKEDYVTSMLLETAKQIDYKITEEDIRTLIKNIVDVTKSVNAQ